jgi:hypothetical protein
MVDLSVQSDHPLASDGITSLYILPFSLDPPSAVLWSEDNQGQLISRALASAAKAANPQMA